MNGRPEELEVRPEALLLDVRRDRLQLKSARRPCDMQVCGACTVLLDGTPVSACTFLALEADGREVLTVEGLAVDGRLDPLQEAFIEHGAVQCDFCTATATAPGRSAPRASARADSYRSARRSATRWHGSPGSGCASCPSRPSACGARCASAERPRRPAPAWSRACTGSS